MRKYDNCEYCGGDVHERQVMVDLRRGDHLFIFENVPVGVCQKCGERYYRGPVLERLEEISEHEEMFEETIRVPKFNFAEVEV